ncbi:tetratricopeptide repeat protein [bacterium]|nr:tetratricopeptide repeat protein [bacterium]
MREVSVQEHDVIFSGAWFWLLLGAVVLAYSPTFLNGFCYDDLDLIQGNHLVLNGEWREIWHQDMWQSSRGASPYYRPLIITFLALEYHLFGDKAWGYHLVSLCLHLLVVLLLYRVSVLTGLFRANPRAALALSSFFALHPALTQTVYWISARAEIMVTLAVLLGMYLIQNGEGPLLFFLPLCAGLALFSKETGVLYYVLVPLYLVFFDTTELKKRKIMLFIMLTVPVLLLYLYLRSMAVSVSPFEYVDESFWHPDDGHARRLLTVSIIWAYYWLRAIFPFYLNFESGIHLFYSFLDWQFLGGCLLSMFSVVIGVWSVKKDRVYIWFWLFWGMALAPVLNILPAFESGMEHYLYLPLVAVALIAGLIYQKEPWFRRLFPLIMIAYALTVFLRGPVWRNNTSLWTDAKEKTSLHCRQGWTRSRINLALTYLESARGATEPGPFYNRAEAIYREILEHYPGYGGTYKALGNLALLRGDYRKAEQYLNEALDHYPNSHALYNKRGIVHVQQKNFDRAADDFRKAMHLKSDFQDPIVNLGRLSFIRGDLVSARQLSAQLTTWTRQNDAHARALERALAFLDNSDLSPGPDDLDSTVILLDESRRYADKAALLEKITRLEPDQPEPLYRLCLTLLNQLADKQKGRLYLDRGIARFPTEVRFMRERAVLHILDGQPEHASSLFRRILELEPDHPEAARMKQFLAQQAS